MPPIISCTLCENFNENRHCGIRIRSVIKKLCDEDSSYKMPEIMILMYKILPEMCGKNYKVKDKSE